jgi:predicted nuclease with RNAse H fold
MKTLGIDLAAQAKNTAACLVEWSRNNARVSSLEVGLSDEALLDLVDGADKVGIDAPFGWPDEFVDALSHHAGLRAWPGAAHGDPDAFRAMLSFRATDRAVAPVRRPLSVSTDKIGVTAMRCAALLHRIGRVDRAGRGKVIEVYPAAALARWSLQASRYKAQLSAGALPEMVAALRAALPTLDLRAAATATSSDHAFDALICALVGRAAALGLTDPPPRPLLRRAKREGWIHVPRRGTLPFLVADRTEVSDDAIRERTLSAVRRSMRDRRIRLDTAGRTATLEENLPGLTPAVLEEIRREVSEGDGNELSRAGGLQPNLHSAWSSAALAINTFARWRGSESRLRIGGIKAPGPLMFERKSAIGLRGRPPNLDVLAVGDQSVLAIESKFTETLEPHTAAFSSTYVGAVQRLADRRWRAEYERLLKEPQRYRFLDAAQLVKHYLGLRNSHAEKAVALVYLFWEPKNAPELAPFATHRAEVREFAQAVEGADLRFLALSYRELWASWTQRKSPEWLSEHVDALVRRYDLTV